MVLLLSSMFNNMRKLTCCGRRIDTSNSAFGELQESSDLMHDAPGLRQRLEQTGYLFFRGLLDRDDVLAARRQVLTWLDFEGHLSHAAPLMEAVAKGRLRKETSSEDNRFPAVRRLANARPLLDLFTRLLDGHVRSYDHIWLRHLGPNRSTGPHCDFVYMGRGTKRLYTMWTPLGDAPLEQGPLLLLEKSHLLPELTEGYARMDIDENGNRSRLRFRHGTLFRGGDYSRNAKAIQRRFGLRWLSSDFKAGDVVIFSAFLLHGSLDNMSRRVRLSMDARYQLAAEPIDERWIGEQPIGHSMAK